ncbi:hypothetical protein HDU99_001107 [Rhizoclosmatium hyalinum]|nr:hypothetical protein HDU99_001107 [Rhizoclosmatium hyalinum]
MHTLVLLDILYKNCGIVFVNNWAIYLHLFRNFLERKETSQANVEIAMRLVAGWQTVEVDRTYDLINTQIDSLDKVTRFFDSMMRAKYPFTEESLKNIDPARIERNRASKNVMTAADFFKEGASKMNDGRDFTFKTYREGYHAL